MAAEAVIGQDAAQVRVAGEEDPEHVVDLPLEPVGRGVDLDDRRHEIFFPHGDLHPDAGVLVHRQEVVDDIEARRALRVIDAGDIDQCREAAGVVDAQEFDEIDQTGQRHGDVQFTERDLGRDHVIRALQLDMGGKLIQGFGHLFPPQRTSVPVRRIFRCN